MILPLKRRKALTVDSKRMLLFGSPKCGKTTIVSGLDDCLIVDLERGSNYVDGMIVPINTFAEYADLIKSLKQAKIDNGGKNPYKFIAIDTLTALEELSLVLAKQLYMATSMGVNFKGSDVRTLANGAGYLYTRQAFMKMLKPFEEVCDNLIMIGHIKEKELNSGTESWTEKSINLTGKTKDILCAWSDTIGMVYREDNMTCIDFSPSDSLIVGSRQKHLIGKKIVVAESDKDNNLKVDWSTIYLEGKSIKNANPVKEIIDEK